MAADKTIRDFGRLFRVSENRADGSRRHFWLPKILAGIPGRILGKKKRSGITRRKVWHGNDRPGFPGEFFRQNKSLKEFLEGVLAWKHPSKNSWTDLGKPEIAPKILAEISGKWKRRRAAGAGQAVSRNWARGFAARFRGGRARGPQCSNGQRSGDAGCYDPAANTWPVLPTAGVPPGRYHEAAGWDGNEMLIWSGLNSNIATSTVVPPRLVLPEVPREIRELTSPSPLCIREAAAVCLPPRTTALPVNPGGMQKRVLTIAHRLRLTRPWNHEDRMVSGKRVNETQAGSGACRNPFLVF